MAPVVRTRSARGPVVRALRQARDMTVGDLALAAGLSKGYLSYVERDQRTASQAVTRALADALDVAPEAITGQSPPIGPLRRALGIDTATFAAGVGLTEDELVRIELGIGGPRSRRVLDRIARQLGVDASLIESAVP